MYDVTHDRTKIIKRVPNPTSITAMTDAKRIDEYSCLCGRLLRPYR